MRTLFCALALAFVLMGCGSSGPPAVEESPVLEASMGVPPEEFVAGGEGVFPVTVWNYAGVGILDMGVRRLGETEWQGGLVDHDPWSFGLPDDGGTLWLHLDHGIYEGFIETTMGRVEFVGGTSFVDVAGHAAPVPMTLYLFGGVLGGA